MDNYIVLTLLHILFFSLEQNKTNEYPHGGNLLGGLLTAHS